MSRFTPSKAAVWFEIPVSDVELSTGRSARCLDPDDNSFGPSVRWSS